MGDIGKPRRRTTVIPDHRPAPAEPSREPAQAPAPAEPATAPEPVPA